MLAELLAPTTLTAFEAVLCRKSGEKCSEPLTHLCSCLPALAPQPPKQLNFLKRLFPFFKQLMMDNIHKSSNPVFRNLYKNDALSSLKLQ